MLLLDTRVAGTQCPELQSWDVTWGRSLKALSLPLAPLGHAVLTHVFHLVTAKPGGVQVHSLQGSEYTLVFPRQSKRKAPICPV